MLIFCHCTSLLITYVALASMLKSKDFGNFFIFFFILAKTATPKQVTFYLAHQVKM